MAPYIDKKFWRSALTKTNWYVILADDFKRLEDLAEQHKNEPDYKQVKRTAYELVEEAVRDGSMPLATQGDDLDSQRKPIDTIVIHHTKNPSGITMERLNAIQLLRIYGRYFANPTDPNEHYLKGMPIWSGHFYEGKQVFWGYHWLIRENGTLEHILKDDYIGWHAGNWDVNKRSIGICIDDDLSRRHPSDTVINSVAELIRSRYKNISTDRVFGHCDVNKHTQCPGLLFHKAWKQKLLQKLS